jgi:hypothetical protein
VYGAKGLMNSITCIMNGKSLRFVLPITYVIVFLAFFLIVNFDVSRSTEGQSVLFSTIYSMGVMMKPVYSTVFAILLLLPLVGTLISLWKKNRNWLIGSFISLLMSVSWVLLAFIMG